MKFLDYNLYIINESVEVDELEREKGKSEYVGNKYPITDPSAIKDFMFAGKSIFTLESTSGVWYTYKVSGLEKPKNKYEENLRFVAVLRGPGINSYSYMGKLYNGVFSFTPKSKFTKDAVCVKAFLYFFKKLKENNLDPRINFYHMGICGRCGRALTVPSSIQFGFGPHCAKIVIQQDAAKFGL